MKVLVAGAGKVGAFIAAELSEAGHEVIIVDANPARGRATARPDVTGWHQGSYG